MTKYAWVLVMAAVMVFGFNASAEEKKDAKGAEHKRGESWNPEAAFAKMDANSDGKVSKDEYVTAQEERAKKSGHEMKKEEIEARFAKKDLDKDGAITKEEWKASYEKSKEHHAAKQGEQKSEKPEEKK